MDFASINEAFRNAALCLCIAGFAALPLVGIWLRGLERKPSARRPSQHIIPLSIFATLIAFFSYPTRADKNRSGADGTGGAVSVSARSLREPEALRSWGTDAGLSFDDIRVADDAVELAFSWPASVRFVNDSVFLLGKSDLLSDSWDLIGEIPVGASATNAVCELDKDDLPGSMNATNEEAFPEYQLAHTYDNGATSNYLHDSWVVLPTNYLNDPDTFGAWMCPSDVYYDGSYTLRIPVYWYAVDDPSHTVFEMENPNVQRISIFTNGTMKV